MSSIATILLGKGSGLFAFCWPLAYVSNLCTAFHVLFTEALPGKKWVCVCVGRGRGGVPVPLFS